MDAEPKVFRMAKGYRTFIYIFGPVLAAGGLGLAGYQLLAGGAFFSAKVLILTVVGLGFVALGVGGIVESVRSRLELLPDRLRYVGIFKTKDYLLAELEGFRVLNNQGASYIQLFAAGGKVAGLIGLQYEGMSEIGPWIEARLENLDSKDLKSEVAEVVNDASLGNTEEERKERLAWAWRWGAHLHKASFACAFWGMLFPKPYEVFFFTALALPLLGLYLARLSHGVFRLDGSGKGIHPLIFPVLIFPAAVLALRSMQDWEILAWTPFWMPFAVCAACFFLAVYAVIPDVRQKFANAAITAIIALIYGYGAVLGLNGLLDSSAPARYATTIARKYSKDDRPAKYYFVAARTKELDFPKDIRVCRKMYNARRVGDPVTVHIHPGRLRIPWFDVE